MKADFEHGAVLLPSVRRPLALEWQTYAPVRASVRLRAMNGLSARSYDFTCRLDALVRTLKDSPGRLWNSDRAMAWLGHQGSCQSGASAAGIRRISPTGPNPDPGADTSPQACPDKIRALGLDPRPQIISVRALSHT